MRVLRLVYRNIGFALIIGSITVRTFMALNGDIVTAERTLNFMLAILAGGGLLLMDIALGVASAKQRCACGGD